MMPNGDPSKLSSEKPLLGCQVCCTSIPQEDRVQIAEWAEELGAEHALDLTSDVTHLIVGDAASAKYQYVAKERDDVRVLLPEFIHTLRKLWITDEPIDLPALEAHFRCPALLGTQICMTGFEDQTFRSGFERSVEENGGVFSGDLTRKCTHLVARAPSGKKYEFASRWGLKIVSLMWYKETLERGMQLDESLYHPTIAQTEQGKGAWNRQPKPAFALGKRTRTDQATEQKSRKLRRTASARLGSQHNDIWTDIVGPAKPSKDLGNSPPTLRSTKSLSDIRNSETQPEPLDESASVQLLAEANNATFANKKFLITGFPENKQLLVSNALSGHGGEVLQKSRQLMIADQEDHQSCFMVVPHEIEAVHLELLEKKHPNLVMVTELWVEWCIKSKQFVPPDQYLLGKPVVRNSGMLAMKGKTVNATGFPQRQLLHIAKILTKLGAIYMETFTQEVSLVICSSQARNREKLAHAKAWNIPVVSEQWLWTLIKSRRVPPVEAHTIIPLQRPSQQAPAHLGPNAGEKDQRPQPLHVTDSNDVTGNQNPVLARDTAIIDEAIQVDEEEQQNASELPMKDNSEEGDFQKISRRKKLFQVYQPGRESKIDLDNTTAMLVGGEGQENAAATESPNDDRENAPIEALNVPDQARTMSRGDMVEEFLQMKAAAEAKRVAAETDGATKARRRKLIGRATSNLSSTSRASNDSTPAARQPLSRASSINSLNTDGLGMPLSALAKNQSETHQRLSTNKARPAQTLLKGNPTIVRKDPGPGRTENHTSSSIARPTSDAPSHADFFAELTRLSTSQLPNPPQPTPEPQISYADSDIAAASKAKWSEVRRRQVEQLRNPGDPSLQLSREESDEQRQREWRESKARELRGEDVIKDDVALVGMGRRTRGREKALNLMHDEHDEIDKPYY